MRSYGNICSLEASPCSDLNFRRSSSVMPINFVRYEKRSAAMLNANPWCHSPWEEYARYASNACIWMDDILGYGPAGIYSIKSDMKHTYIVQLFGLRLISPTKYCSFMEWNCQ